jgi:pyruvate formate lyase activating enzyme
MPQKVTTPPDQPMLASGHKPGGWWHQSDDPTRIVCDLCPRGCVLRPGDRGFCFVRENQDGQMVSTTYGRSTGFCVDPIEKKPLHQFYPGTAVLSFGTAGCNLGCTFCQNWTMSRSRDVEAACETADPESIAAAAVQLGCRSVAFTYNDPIIWAEYAIDTARVCRSAGVKTVAVTSGYITAAARAAFYQYMDAANVDLKGFSEDFYRQHCAGRLQPVLDTLRWLARESNVWVEITNLIIPRANDAPDEIKRMCQWIVEELGPDVPLHFSAFHPDFKLIDRGATPVSTLITAYDLARQAGIRYVYTGNVIDREHQHTYCPGCGRAVIQRNGYDLGEFAIRAGRCMFCQAPIAGHFEDSSGSWGSRRLPVRIANFVKRRS